MSMPIPKTSKNAGKKKIWKICKECEKEYFGPVISKYCEIHRDVSKRKRVRKTFEEPSVKNKVFNHRFNDVVNLEFLCQLDGCHKRFKVKVYPKIFVYPKYCEKHRNEYRRVSFKREVVWKKKIF